MDFQVSNLRVQFPAPRGPIDIVRGVSFAVGREKVAIVGESGSGKSLTARSILGLQPAQARVFADQMTFNGTPLLEQGARQMEAVRGKGMGFILQDPKYSLNPVKTVGDQIAETWRVHKGGSRRAAYEQALDLLSSVRIRDPERVAASYPHQLSGGMGQRIMIAMVLAPDPEMLIADEPTSALDATVQAEILKLIDELVQARGMGLLIISHDLPLISHFCDRVLVMYAGRIVEELRAGDLSAAKHSYTQGLLACVPSLTHPHARFPVLARDQGW